ncbi:MAG: helix-turn-helix domain-containing protein [Tannerellaceae bacterium]|jgi:plasmid maintenance system antidote protein VapI|nr:helix-turn-helix domain-containing protein [Tannerellaceae bacterium]
MYEQYLSMPAVPAGAILKRILQKEHLSQKEIAEKLAIYPQRINDLISGKQRFTIELSFRLEKALSIPTLGYFYRIQANHEIYRHQDEQERKYTPDLSKINKTLFWETPSLDAINWQKNGNWVIQRTFEYGDQQEIEEIIRYYGHEKVSEVLNAIPVTDTWKMKDRNKNRKIFGV